MSEFCLRLGKFFCVLDIFVVISVVDADHYRLEIVSKAEVPPYGPPIPTPGIFKKNSMFRDFLFTKCKLSESKTIRF